MEEWKHKSFKNLILREFTLAGWLLRSEEK
jgi:hypothetical protein